MRFHSVLTPLLCAGSALLAVGNTGQASDWMFRRSYYSHAPEPSDVGYPESRSARRQPFAGAHPRSAIRGGYRYNNVVIQSGNSFDRTVIRENWFDAEY